MNVIEVKNLQKQFQNKSALSDVTFTIPKGEIFGLLGPSGSGKTTTIKILTGQLFHSGGVANVFNAPVAKMREPENRKRMGILTDNSGLYIRLSIEENLELYCGLYNVPKQAIKEALDFVRLYDDRKKKVNTLSKGMHQRVILARAILHQPELLFLDEPTSALDPASTAHIHRGLRELNKRGTTIFLTTHDMLEAESLCDKIAFLDRGKIQAIGSPQALKEEYSEKTMTIILHDGAEKVLKQDVSQAELVYNLMSENKIKKIYTNEPTLGDIFMKITGSDLQ